jgi:hypothetical protein
VADAAPPQEIEKALNSRNHSSLEYLTSRFYTLIPHNFGRNRPPLIKDLETLKQKMQMLEVPLLQRKKIFFFFFLESDA